MSLNRDRGSRERIGMATSLSGRGLGVALESPPGVEEDLEVAVRTVTTEAAYGANVGGLGGKSQSGGKYDDREGVRYYQDDARNLSRSEERYRDTDRDRERDRGRDRPTSGERDRGGSEGRYERREMTTYSSSDRGGTIGGVGGAINTYGGGGSYRPMMTSRNLVIQRSSYNPSSSYGYGVGSGANRVTRTVEKNYRSTSSGGGGAFGGGFAAGAYANMTNTEVNSMRVSREKEKRDMQDLNERFASYIEKVRFLEAQNRKLADELEKLKSNWGRETSAVKTMFETELNEARRLLDDSEKDKARLEIRNATLEEQITELRDRADDSDRLGLREREKLEKQNQQLSDYEAEINLLRRRVEGFENDRERDRRQINQLTDGLNRARIDLDNETLQHVDAENRRQTLEEEIEFMRAIHDQEMRELAALVYRDTTTENREFWKNEMGQALREIQQVYDDKLDNMRTEMESFYNVKIQEFRAGATRQNVDVVHSKEVSTRMKTQMTELYDKISDLDGKNQALLRELESIRRTRDENERQWESENGDLRSEVAKLRAELESIMQELQNIMHAKLGLEMEIAAYRKLLESEEDRLSTYRRDMTVTTTTTDSKTKYGGGQDREGDRGGDGDIGRGGGGTMGTKGGTTARGGSRGAADIGRDRDRDTRDRDRDIRDNRDNKDRDIREGDRDRVDFRDSRDSRDRDYRDAGGRGGAGGNASGGGNRGSEWSSRDQRERGGTSATVGFKDSEDGYSGVGYSRGGQRGVRDGSGGRVGVRDGSGGRGDESRGDDSYSSGGGGRGRSPGRATSMIEKPITAKTDRRAYAMPEMDEDGEFDAYKDEADRVGEKEKPGEGTAKTSLQRSAKGPVVFGDCEIEGRFIGLENSGRKDENLEGWSLRRTVDGVDQPPFVFPDNFVLRPGSVSKIWSSGFRPNNLAYNDLVAGVNKWGQGNNVTTRLINPTGDERASHVQKTTYTP